ncbi:hypothetical protein [Variovorax sp. IB41]|uniref:hypothetical protein n=1 Tax=Variovorax sp. IB41 TaxID=2779370 RepID=UPI0018E80C9F|nr:hypothetical protein [Variovorax sp. IB41]MBJ2155583.1 hypothetical protein [Variovorax sp. IB41]
MLSCYGLAVFAQGLMGAGHPAHAGADMQTCVTTGMSLSDAFVSDAMDLADELPSHDEAGSEHVELVDARHPVPVVLFLSEQPRGLALTPALSPLLDRPKRPPRGTALVA